MFLLLMLLSSSRSNLENNILKIERQSYIYWCCFRLWMVYHVKFLSISRKYRSQTLLKTGQKPHFLGHPVECRIFWETPKRFLGVGGGCWYKANTMSNHVQTSLIWDRDWVGEDMGGIKSWPGDGLDPSLTIANISVYYTKKS